MTRPWHILLIGFGLISGCGKDKPVTPSGTVEKQVIRLETSGDGSQESEDKVRSLMKTYQDYILLRDGVPPAKDPLVRRAAVDNYREALDRVKTINAAFLSSASEECRRFVNVHNKVSESLLDGFTELLNPDLDPDRANHLAARVITLNWLEETLYSLTYYRAEAGYSDLDPSQRESCPAPDRNAFEEAYFQASLASAKAREVILGKPGLKLPITPSAPLAEAYRQDQKEQALKRGGLLAAEIAASIILYERYFRTYLNRWTDKMRAAGKPRWARFSRFLANALYFAGWVKVDRELREHVDFFGEPPSIRDETTLSSWERTLRLTEAVASADIEAPALYYQYLRLISSVEYYRALDFLTNYEWVLVEAEEKFGSVDAALENLKEVSGL